MHTEILFYRLNFSGMNMPVNILHIKMNKSFQVNERFIQRNTLKWFYLILSTN